MFKAVRDYARHWWNPELPDPQARRTRRLSRLFLFEFTVVVLGVLVAQSLQDYASDLRARSDMRVQRARADFQIADSRNTSEFWLALAPCLSAQMDRVMRTVAAGETPASRDIATPPYFTSRISPWSEQSILTLRRDYGDNIAAHYVSLVDIAAFQTDHIRQLSREWAPLARADPAFGPISPADRDAVRAAASSVKAQLERIVSNSRSAVRRARELGIAAHTVDPVPDLPKHCASGQRTLR